MASLIEKQALNAAELKVRIKACTICAPYLPHAPRPVVHFSHQAQILIVGQAPGARVHRSGVPWDDASGDRLRCWLGVDADLFYDEGVFAIAPMGFCYPGKGPGGDLPPRSECAPRWMPQILKVLPKLRLTLLVGQYAQAFFLGDKRYRTLADTVRNYREYLPSYFVLPHPSPRNNLWLRRHPWFEEQVQPELQHKITELISPS